MLDLKFVRENPDIVKQNIKNKFQDRKLPLVDEVIELDAQARATKTEADELRANRNKLSKQIGALMAQGKKEEAETVKAQVNTDADRLKELEAKETELNEKVTKIMMTIPNIIDPSVPIGKDDSENVEIEKFGEPVVPDFEIPYHTEIMQKFNGIDLDAAGKVAGNGFYYLMGDIARLHSAVISYARDFMIDRGFTYCIPPYMIRSNVVTGVMSFDEMDAMMYKIEGEDLYLIGTSEHSMIGKFIDTITPEEELPKTLTSYSPCFRKEKGAHGIEERGVYRIHQFEKQEMIVVCKPEDSKMWFDKLWQNTVDMFRSLDIPVRTLECCSGDLADLKVKSIDVEAWSSKSCKNPEAAFKIINYLIANEQQWVADGISSTEMGTSDFYPLYNGYDNADEIEVSTETLEKYLAGEITMDDVDFSQHKLLKSDMEAVKELKKEPYDDFSLDKWNLDSDLAKTNLPRLVSLLVGGASYVNDKYVPVYNAYNGQTETMEAKWANLKKMEEETFAKIITGKADISEFDTFVENWKSQGGDQILKEINDELSK